MPGKPIITTCPGQVPSFTSCSVACTRNRPPYGSKVAGMRPMYSAMSGRGSADCEWAMA